MNAPQDSRDYYRLRKQALLLERQPYETLWKDLGDNFLPFRGRWDGETVQQRKPKQIRRIIDPTPLLAARTAASGMLAGFTSPSRQWFRAVTRRSKLRENSAVSRWLDEATRLLLDTFAACNFYNAMPSLYAEGIVFGTGAALVLPDPKTIIRVFPLTAGTYTLAANENNVIDTMYRDVVMSVRQAARLFGEKALSSAAQQMLERSPDALIAVTHSIEPREKFNRAYYDVRNMPFVSCWWETASTENKVLRVSGFRRFPVVAPRWEVNDTDVYGNGAGAIALGMAKDLQLSHRRKQQNKDKMANPTLLAPSSLRNRTISQTSGDVVYYDAVGGGDSPTVKPMYVVDPRSVQVLMEDIETMREAINRTFYVDLFRMLTMSDRRQMTAREVEERHEEKLLMLSPVLERHEDELLDIAIELTFDELVMRGKMPLPPRELRDPEAIEIEYISILSQAQRAVGMGAVEKLYTTAGALFQMTQNPEVWDKVDTDQILDEVAMMTGVVPTTVRSDEEVKQIRATRQQAIQAQQQAELAAQQAQTAKTLSETPTQGGGTMLDDLQQQAQGTAA